MESHVIEVKYQGPVLSSSVGYAPRWYHLLTWRTVLPALLLANAILQTFDVLTTWWAISHGAAEANPISRSMMDAWGFAGWAVAKISLAGFFVAHVPFLDHLHGHTRAVMGRVTATVAVLMFAVVLANAAQVLVFG